MGDLATYAKEHNIKFFLFNFTDLFGVQRAKLVPAEAAKRMQKAGAGFAGFATWLDQTPAHPDILVMPDTNAIIPLPWRPEVAWVAGEPWMNGEPLAQAPRVVLAQAHRKICGQGHEADGRCGARVPSDQCRWLGGFRSAAIPRTSRATIRPRSCAASMSSARSRTTMVQLGWGPYQNDHEDANGQFEINWNFNDALTTADQLAFFKFMVKSIAEKHGMRATFMPKPFINLTGNGCHVHLSVWDNERKTNLFEDEKGELGVSQLGYHFLGGLMHHAAAMTAITNPTVNSYKRINAPRTISGATWSPSSITYGGNNRTHMVRIPDGGRAEYRLPDNAANPYLLLASILVAGMHGIEAKMDPGKRLDIDMYAEGHTVKDAKKLPLNLLDALQELRG